MLSLLVGCERDTMEYKYVCVSVADGGSWLLYGDERRKKNPLTSEDLTALPELLAEGWVPVRETAGGASSYGRLHKEAASFSLVLLAKEN